MSLYTSWSFRVLRLVCRTGMLCIVISNSSRLCLSVNSWPSKNTCRDSSQVFWTMPQITYWLRLALMRKRCWMSKVCIFLWDNYWSNCKETIRIRWCKRDCLVLYTQTLLTRSWKTELPVWSFSRHWFQVQIISKSKRVSLMDMILWFLK